MPTLSFPKFPVWAGSQCVRLEVNWSEMSPNSVAGLYATPRPWHWMTSVVLGAAAIVAFSVVYNCFLSPLANIPGPFLAKISPLWLMRAAWRRRLNQDIKSLHDRYGPVVRLSPSELSFASIRAQEDIHCHQSSQRRHFTKAETLESLMGDIVWPAPNLLTTTAPAEHARLKRALQPAFTQRALADQEAIQQRHVDDMVARLRHEISARASTTLDLSPFLSRAIWHIISDLSFGEPMLQDQLEKFELLKTVFCKLSPILEGLQCVLAIPVLGFILRTTVVLLCKVLWMPSDVLPSSRLRDRIQRQDNQRDFITAILECAEKGVQLSDLEMKSNASLLVMVGYDTTATSLSAAFHLLLRHPEYLSRLRDELRTRFGCSADMTNSRLSTLPLLNGCIQETLRLLPPANGKGTNRTSPGAAIAGVQVPAGVLVSADMYTIQRSADYWRHPDEYRPERWFEGGEFDGDNKSAQRPFLLGSRMCVGRAVAMQALRIAIAKVVYAFELANAEPEYLWERHVQSSYLWIGYRVQATLSELETV
ncbi:hypothetical protein RB598_000550 [Gaeumannomyces tritici]